MGNNATIWVNKMATTIY